MLFEKIQHSRMRCKAFWCMWPELSRELYWYLNVAYVFELCSSASWHVLGIQTFNSVESYSTRNIHGWKNKALANSTNRITSTIKSSTALNCTLNAFTLQNNSIAVNSERSYFGENHVSLPILSRWANHKRMHAHIPTSIIKRDLIGFHLICHQ